uniref:Uncharacterized protein n=1 Tax=Panagrolaimus sp. JU765 TaxID=591449 RepID=A0AC34RI40_9BILA
MGIGEELLQEIKQTPLIVHDESKSEPIGLNSGLDRNHHHLQSNILSTADQHFEHRELPLTEHSNNRDVFLNETHQTSKRI